MRLDSDIRRDIEQELIWDSAVDAVYIAVIVNEGIVTLTGFVQAPGEKGAAQASAMRIPGVLGIANEIEVQPRTDHDQPDPDIALDAVAGLQRAVPEIADRIMVIVAGGWVRLEGEVDSKQQSEQAQAAVREVRGVRGVVNDLRFQPVLEPAGVKQAILAALRRSAEADAEHIIVETEGGTVILKGTVRSWAEREEAVRTAWRAPGITKVENLITVSAG